MLKMSEFPCGRLLLMMHFMICIVSWVSRRHRECLFIEESNDSLLAEQKLNNSLSVLLAINLRQPVFCRGARMSTHGHAPCDAGYVS